MYRSDDRCGGGSRGRRIGGEEATKGGGSVGRKEQRSEGLWGGGNRGRGIGVVEAAKAGRSVEGGQQRSDDRCGEGSRGQTIGGEKAAKVGRSVWGGSRGRTIYMGRAAEVVGGSVWRRRQRSEGRCVGLEGGAKVTRC